MLFLNESEIDWYAQRHKSHPVLGPASLYLAQFKDTVNSCSDGWPYWSSATRSAQKLMELVHGQTPPTPEALRRAQTPIKSFCTRKKITFKWSAK